MSANMDDEPETSPDRISILGTLFKITAIVAASVLFNYYPHKIGFVQSLQDLSSFTPLLTPDFLPWLFWLNLWWGASFALHVVNLVVRRWNVATRLADVAIRLLSVFVLGSMALGASFIEQPVVAVVVRVVLAIACLLSFFETIKQFNRLLISQQIFIELKEG